MTRKINEYRAHLHDAMQKFEVRPLSVSKVEQEDDILA